MAKPIGYYTSVMPNDGSLLDEMQEAWGSQFEALNDCQRCWLMFTLSGLLQQELYEDHHLDDAVTAVAERFDELSNGQKIGLLEALINQVKTL